MHATIRSLEVLYEATQPSNASGATADTRGRQEKREREKQRRLAALSPYKQAEYQTLECIKQLRESLREADTIEGFLEDQPSSSTAVRAVESAADQYQHPYASRDKHALTQDLARARLAARRAHQQLQKLHRDVQRLYMTERQDDTPHAFGDATRLPDNSDACHNIRGGTEERAVTYRELVGHIERATTWYREYFGIHVMSSLDDPLVMGGAPALVKAMSGLGPSSSSSNGGRVNVPGCPGARTREEEIDAAQSQSLRQTRNWREDAEFDQFFRLVEQNDALIDTSLDRIHAGVLRLRDNAVAINTELDVQAGLLNQTEEKIARNAEGVRDLNRRVAKAIRELNDADICAYLVCLLLLVAVLCTLLRALA